MMLVEGFVARVSACLSRAYKLICIPPGPCLFVASLSLMNVVVDVGFPTGLRIEIDAESKQASYQATKRVCVRRHVRNDRENPYKSQGDFWETAV